jgi:hypothetical protein
MIHVCDDIPDCAERSPCALVGRINGVFVIDPGVDIELVVLRADPGVVGRGVNHGDYIT